MHPRLLLLRSKAFPIIGLLFGTLILVSVYQLGKQSSSEISGSRETLSTNTLPGDNVESVEVVSWQPRIFHFHGFLTHEEADHVIKLGGGNLERSMVVGAGGKAVVNPARSSYGTFMSSYMRDPVIKSLEERIAKWTFLPQENGEVFYLLRYENGQEYKAHTDWFHSRGDGTNDHLGRSGQRIATVLMYLSDVEEGGETFFPKANVVVKPKKGDAVLFWNMTPDHTEDDNALHGSKPVIKGTKWSMTRWIRERKA